MKPILALCIFTLLLSFSSHAQQQPQDKKQLRVVDTLTTQERNNRIPVITQAEADSLAGVYNAAHPVAKPDPVKEIVPEVPVYWIAGLVAGVLLVLLLLYTVLTQQSRSSRSIEELNRQLGNLESSMLSQTPMAANDKPVKSRNTSRIADNGRGDLEKLQKEMQSQEALLSEYRFIKKEYETIKQQMTDVFKVRNYPGYDKAKTEQEILEGLLQTEKAVANYAYEHFLKPVIAIADANKNSPSKINAEDRARVMDLLVSLSLFYIEYLYLRVNELAIGGKIAERIGSLRNGTTLNTALLKELNTEHGSRALVVRMVLEKNNINHLSYPVFDETDLNLS